MINQSAEENKRLNQLYLISQSNESLDYLQELNTNSRKVNELIQDSHCIQSELDH